MKYVPTAEFMQDLFGSTVSRASILERLFANSDIAAIAGEHGVERDNLLTAVNNDESSSAGSRLRTAVSKMREGTTEVPRGNAFPPDLDRTTDGGLELIGLFVNPLATTSMILNTAPPPLDDAARAIDPRLSLAAYASRVFRVLAVQHPPLAEALTNAANALERA
ncbi:MAG: hypothetical protein JO322_12560 [Candidatus Eremiobacteraeota bacterium]|nr:hypothetical protein [Candidatus Eremiobacteraeota bacterium]